MSEQMLVTQALDERDLLVKKINDKIGRASFVDGIKPNGEKVMEKRVNRETFEKEAKAAYQQIQDLITRYQKIDAAIIASNAATEITTSYGTYSVAGAIALRNRLRGSGSRLDNTNFEEVLYRKMKNQYDEKVRMIDQKNGLVQTTADGMRLNILGNESKGAWSDKPIAVVEAYIKENTTEMVDPLDICKKMEQMAEKKDVLLKELDTKIKVSNATTSIEID